MAHFARLDENNIVIDVIVIDNNDLLDDNGNESENVGIKFCQRLFVETTRWVQTSYNNQFRGKYASLGDIYSHEFDKFLDPKPFESWTLDTELKDWTAPIEKPTLPEGYYCVWDEEDQQWNIHQNRENF
jgi:hypothetical protein